MTVKQFRTYAFRMARKQGLSMEKAEALATRCVERHVGRPGGRFLTASDLVLQTTVRSELRQMSDSRR